MLRVAARRAASALRANTRSFAGGHEHGHGHGVEYGGLTLHPPSNWHKNAATGMSALMWFWVFLRWKEDGHTLLFGHAAHFEHELAHEEEHNPQTLLYKPHGKLSAGH